MGWKIGIVLLAAAGLVPGCGGSISPALRAGATADEDFNVLWDAATEVLREHRFKVDRTDRRAGVITTFPMIGRHWFEFWRRDAAGPGDVLEGSLQTLYRQATVTIGRSGSPADAPAGAARYVAAVEVQTSRSDRPAAQVTSTSEAYDMFAHPSRIVRGPSGGDMGLEAAGGKVELGRDEQLERILLLRINARANKKRTIYPKPGAIRQP